MKEAATIINVELLAYTVAGLCMMPVLIIGYVFGARPTFKRTATLCGWGAVFVVIFAILATRV